MSTCENEVALQRAEMRMVRWMRGVMPNSHRPPDKTRRSCLCRIWRCELSRPDKCVLRRSASGGRTAPPDTPRHRPDTERTCLAVEPTQFTPPHQTRQNSPICVVSGVAVWISFKMTSWQHLGLQLWLNPSPREIRYRLIVMDKVPQGSPVFGGILNPFWHSLCTENQLDPFESFDRKPACNWRTDRQTNTVPRHTSLRVYVRCTSVANRTNFLNEKVGEQ